MKITAHREARPTFNDEVQDYVSINYYNSANEIYPDSYLVLSIDKAGKYVFDEMLLELIEALVRLKVLDYDSISTDEESPTILCNMF